MLSVARLVSFWRCISVQYNCQKSSNFQGLSHFSRIFGKNDKIPGFFQAGKTVTIFPGFPGAVGTLQYKCGLGLISHYFAILFSLPTERFGPCRSHFTGHFLSWYHLLPKVFYLIACASSFSVLKKVMYFSLDNEEK